MPVSESTYLKLVREDPESKWELHCGTLWSKAEMTWEHGQVAWALGFQLQQQLPMNEYVVRVESGRVRVTESQFFIPDIMVIPRTMARRLFATPGTLAVFPAPLPLVGEVWSPSTGEYDTDRKIPAYRRRGDREIWRLHPYERTLTAWRRQPDGSYEEALHRSGSIQPVALPGVTIDLDALFDA